MSTVHIAVYDDLADWEVGHVAARLSSPMWQKEPGRFTVRTVGPSTEPVRTMGGMRIVPDMALADFDPTTSAMLVLPGSTGYDAGLLDAFSSTAREALAQGTPVAAICGATFGLAKAGVLDERDHTSGAAVYLQMSGYRGGERYVERDAVSDGGVITAGPTEPLAFAREIFRELDVFTPAALDAWFRLFRDSDPAAYAELAAL